MNLQDVTANWVALHEALGVGAPVVSDDQYQQLLTAVDALVDATGGDETHPRNPNKARMSIFGLVRRIARLVGCDRSVRG